MAKLFVPSEFSPHARAMAVAELEEARLLANRAALRFAKARKILEEDAGEEGIAFPFFQAEITALEEVKEDCAAMANSWYPRAES